MQMKTTVVVERFPTVSETFVARHARHFHAAVVCREEDYQLASQGSSAGLRIFSPMECPGASRLIGMPGWFRLRRLFYGVASPRRNFTWNRSMEQFWADYLDRERPDVVLAEFAPNALSALPACRTRGIPVVAHFHGYDASKLMSEHSYRRAVREVFRDAAAVICVSSFMKKRLIYAGCPEQKLHVIPCGADLTVFTPSGEVANQPCRFVAVSRLEPVKGPFVTLEAFRRVHLARPAVTLDWIGAGSLKRPMEEWISRHHLEGAVHMHGALGHSEIPPILRQSSVLLQASLTTADGAVEGWPISIAEALASGLPAIVSRSGGMVELVIDGHNGLLFEEGNSSEMADAMLRLEADPSLRAEMGRKGRHYVETVGDCSRSLRLLEDILRSVCGVHLAEARQSTRHEQIEVMP